LYPIQVDKQVTITAAWFHDKPLEAAAPLLPRWWLIYVSLVAGAALGWFFEAKITVQYECATNEGINAA